MDGIKRLCLTAVCFLFISCLAVRPERPLVDPVTLRFPLVEAGSIDLGGAVAGQPQARDGIVYCATRDGRLTAVVVPARQVFWRFKADHPVSAGPELGEGRVLLRDEGNILYVLDPRGGLLHKRLLGGVVTTAVRERAGRITFGTEDGRIQAWDGGTQTGDDPVWTHIASAPVTAGPAFAGELVLFGTADGRLLALDGAGNLIWEFEAHGPIRADPAVAGDRVYFGTEEMSFFCLDARTGRKRWSRRLQGAPLHPALVHGSKVAVAASNSVVYFLSRRGGSILSWQVVESRIVRKPAAAGPVLLFVSSGRGLAAYDLEAGRRVGEHLSSGAWVSGPVWAPPFVVGFEEDEASGRQRLVLFEHGTKR
jgi:outer membrane protein assembly factor BamB